MVDIHDCRYATWLIRWAFSISSNSERLIHFPVDKIFNLYIIPDRSTYVDSYFVILTTFQ
jgi:hypothetical protein